MQAAGSSRTRAGWLALTALLLLAALAMIHGAQPRQPTMPVAGFAMLNDGLLAGGDTISHDYPAFWWGWRQVREAGRLPLWNPSWLGGLPFIASQTFLPFYPPNWLGAVLPFPLAFNIQYPLHLLLAGLAMAWAVRVRGAGWWAAAVAALAFGFGNHLASLAGPGHLQKLQALAWLPVTATGLAELLRSCIISRRMERYATAEDATRGGRRAGGALALGLGFQIAAGHPQIVFLSLLAGGVEGALTALAVLIQRGRLQWGRPTAHALRRGMLAVLLALAVSAAAWVPLAEFAPLSNRGAGLTWEEQTRGSLPPEEAIEFILPRLRGDSMQHGRGAYLGRYGEAPGASPERIVSDYAGAAALLLALAGLLLPGRRGLAAIGWLLAAIGLALSLGKYAPGFYRTLQLILPGLAGFRSPSTSMALLAYGLALAAAVGADAARLIILGAAPRRRVALLIVIVLLAAVAFVARQAREQAELLRVENFLLEQPGAAHLMQAALAQAAGGWTAVLGAAFAALLAAELHSPGVRRFALGAAALGLLLAQGMDQWRNARVFWNAEPIAPYREYLTQHWALPTWERESAPVRYLEPGNELSNRALTLSDYARFRQIGTLTGYQPVGYQRYFELVRALGWSSDVLQELFAVNYLLWPENEPLPGGWVERARGGGRRLLYNPDAAYVRPIEHLQAVADWPAALARFAQPGFRPYESTTVLDDLLSPEHRGRSGALPAMGLQWRSLMKGPGDVELRLSARRKGSVSVAEPAVPGWRVFLNGQRARYMPQSVDGYFVSLTVPAGRTTAVLRYDPVSQRLGLFISLLTAALLMARAGWRAAARREG